MKFHDIFQSANDKKNIQLSPEEGKLLSILIAIHKSKYVLELGTLVGYSCCWIASSLPKDGKVITLEADINRHNIAKQNFAKSYLI
jgi:predicted O-methyltransferase YrrM